MDDVCWGQMNNWESIAADFLWRAIFVKFNFEINGGKLATTTFTTLEFISFVLTPSGCRHQEIPGSNPGRVSLY